MIIISALLVAALTLKNLIWTFNQILSLTDLEWPWTILYRKITSRASFRFFTFIIIFFSKIFDLTLLDLFLLPLTSSDLEWLRNLPMLYLIIISINIIKNISLKVFTIYLIIKELFQPADPTDDSLDEIWWRLPEQKFASLSRKK